MVRLKEKGGAEFATVYNYICYIIGHNPNRYTTNWIPMALLCLRTSLQRKVSMELRGHGHLEPMEPLLDHAPWYPRIPH